MTATKWETTTKSPAVLSLDPKNPRLAQITEQSTERELLEELVTKEDVYFLARNISENGYFQNEILVGIREGKKIIIVEGNRRLAACKLLISPEAGPADVQGKFRSLSVKANLSQLKEIPVCIAPSREATHPLVLNRHTKLSISKWEPVMQAKFFRQLIDIGMSIEEIAKTAIQTVGTVRDSLRDYHLYEMACRLNLPPEIGLIVHDPHSFSLSTLGRVFDVPEARDFFGVEVDHDGEIHGKITEEEFTKGFEKIVTDVARAETVTSRSLNRAADVAKYLSDFPDEIKPNGKRKGSFKSSTFRLSVKSALGSASGKKQKKNRITSKLPVGLIPSTVACNVQNQRVRNIFAELRRLSPERFPNACALGFRLLLEASVYCFLDSKGHVAAMIADYKAGIIAHNIAHPTRPKAPEPHWSPTLNAMIKRLRDPKLALISSPHVSKALGRALDEEEELFGLNLYTHNTTYHPDGKRLRKTWQGFEEFMKIILA
jgi:hypothetical protein